MRYAALLPAHPVASAVTEYAVGFGQDFYRVFTEVPYVRVLLAVFCLRDRQRILDLHVDGERIEAAVLNSYAFNEPTLISKEQNRFLARLRVDPMTGKAKTTEAVEDALRMIREARERST